jgi:ATP-dependent DNA helicase RecQ
MARRGVPVSGRLSSGERVGEGRVIARLTDLGWGQRLRRTLAPDTPDGPADDALVAACVEVLRGWEWRARPAAVAWIPSQDRPALIASVAEAVARIGRLDLLGPLALTGHPPDGEHAGNSAFRLAQVWDRFAVPPGMAASLRRLGDAPVLLVDDLVDTRWTMTVAGAVLRRAGASGVLPFALAAVA